MQKIRHKTNGQVIEFGRVVDDSRWLDCYDGESDENFSGTFRKDFWEVVEPTHEDIIVALEIGSTFHFEYEDGNPSAGYMKSYDNTVIGYAGGKIRATDFGNTDAKLVVDFEYPKTKED